MGSDLVKAFSSEVPSHSFVRRDLLRPMARKPYPASSRTAMLCGTMLFRDAKVSKSIIKMLALTKRRAVPIIFVFKAHVSESE